MRKQIFLSVLFAFASFSMAFAQFPLMDLVGNTVSISPTSYQFAVGADEVTDPNTKVLIKGGKLELSPIHFERIDQNQPFHRPWRQLLFQHNRRDKLFRRQHFPHQHQRRRLVFTLPEQQFHRR